MTKINKNYTHTNTCRQAHNQARTNKRYVKLIVSPVKYDGFENVMSAKKGGERRRNNVILIDYKQSKSNHPIRIVADCAGAKWVACSSSTSGFSAATRESSFVSYEQLSSGINII